MTTKTLSFERVDAAYVKMAYRNMRPRGHWFSRETMSFFHTRIGEAWRVGDVFFFVTSEQPPHGNRAYSVRRMSETGDIHTVGEFCQIETRQEAVKALHDAVEAERPRGKGGK